VADVLDQNLVAIRKSSRLSALISLVGFLIVLGSIVYSSIQLTRLEQKRQELEQQQTQLKSSIASLQQKTADLTLTQGYVLDFVGGVAAKENLRMLDPDVNWDVTKQQLVDMPVGPRKAAVFKGILLAWKAVPFSLNNTGMKSGLDSPHFINVILSNSGVVVNEKPGQRLSDAMMSQFEKVDHPLPGDLAFFHGNVGSFVLMYMAPGTASGQGVALGTLQTGEEVQITDLSNINVAHYPFIGFYRVPYR
jgi:hypothetical protein